MNYDLVGNFVQHIEVTLAPGEDFYAEKGALIYLESGVEKHVKFNGSKIFRVISAKISGESLFIMRLHNASNQPKKVVLGSSCGLHPVHMSGETMICHRGVYVASDNKVTVSTKMSITGLTSGMGMLLQKISGNGTVFLDTIGDPITLELKSGETVEVDEDHIIAMHSIAESQISSKWAVGNLVGGEGLSVLKITGPGRVYLSPGSFKH